MTAVIKRSFYGRLAQCAALSVGLFICLHADASADSTASEYAVKAAIIYKIAKFVSWPKDAGSYEDQQLRICLPEKDPIGPAVEALAGEIVHGRLIEILRFDYAHPVHAECEILYLSRPTVEQHRTLLSRVSDAPVLTIGDSENFVQSGGMISLEIQESRVQFAINIDASQRAGLDISSQLLQLAKIDK